MRYLLKLNARFSLNGNLERVKKLILKRLNKDPVVILRLNKNLENKKIISYIKSLSKIMGQLVPQNKLGKKYVYVFDRKRNSKQFSKQRYHQTRDGGYIHTDNVNIKEKWDYMLLGCVSKGMVGGETILIYARDLYRELKKFPNVVDQLRKDFYWYKKGFSNEIFKRPILTVHNGKAEFRYLRSYLEEAYEIKKINFTNKQIFSLNVLDSLLSLKKLQKRLTLEKGDILIGKDSEFLHGRTEFVDNEKAISVFKKNKNHKAPFKRTLVRTWIRKK